MEDVAELRPARRRARRARRSPVRRLLVALLVVVVITPASVLLWSVYGTTWMAQNRARQVVASTATAWPDGVVAIVTIDRLGLTWPVADNITDEALATGMGWYPTSAEPGQVGNCAIAGQRVGRGAPFAHLLELQAGDQITLTTATDRFTYLVTVAPANLTVSRDAAWVLDPVPGNPGLEPTEAVLTLTTAQDLFDSGDRAVAFAVLISNP